MDSQLFATLITVGVAMAGSIIADIIVIRKENSRTRTLDRKKICKQKASNFNRMPL